MSSLLLCDTLLLCSSLFPCEHHYFIILLFVYCLFVPTQSHKIRTRYSNQMLTFISADVSNYFRTSDSQIFDTYFLLLSLKVFRIYNICDVQSPCMSKTEKIKVLINSSCRIRILLHISHESSLIMLHNDPKRGSPLHPLQDIQTSAKACVHERPPILARYGSLCNSADGRLS